MTVTASVLSLFSTSNSDSTTSLLSALYGNGSSSTSTSSGADPISALQTAETRETKDVAAVAKQPDVARDIAAFRTAVATAKTPAQLLANPKALKVLLTANGLGDQTAYTALAVKALTSDTSKANNLASQLTNTAWLSTAKLFDFANKGLTTLNKSSVLDTIANGYAEVKWRTSLDQTTPGLSNALDFRSRASSISSVDGILGDSTLRTVVTTALGIPVEIALQPLEAQEQAISSRLDITKFKNKTFVDQFTKRYLIAASTAAASTSTTTTGITSLFA